MDAKRSRALPEPPARGTRHGVGSAVAGMEVQRCQARGFQPPSAGCEPCVFQCFDVLSPCHEVAIDRVVACRFQHHQTVGFPTCGIPPIASVLGSRGNRYVRQSCQPARQRVVGVQTGGGWADIVRAGATTPEPEPVHRWLIPRFSGAVDRVGGGPCGRRRCGREAGRTE